MLGFLVLLIGYYWFQVYSDMSAHYKNLIADLKFDFFQEPEDSESEAEEHKENKREDAEKEVKERDQDLLEKRSETEQESEFKEELKALRVPSFTKENDLTKEGKVASFAKEEKETKDVRSISLTKEEEEIKKKRIASFDKEKEESSIKNTEILSKTTNIRNSRKEELLKQKQEIKEELEESEELDESESGDVEEQSEEQGAENSVPNDRAVYRPENTENLEVEPTLIVKVFTVLKCFICSLMPWWYEEFRRENPRIVRRVINNDQPRQAGQEHTINPQLNVDPNEDFPIIKETQMKDTNTENEFVFSQNEKLENLSSFKQATEEEDEPEIRQVNEKS